MYASLYSYCFKRLISYLKVYLKKKTAEKTFALIRQVLKSSETLYKNTDTCNTNAVQDWLKGRMKVRAEQGLNRTWRIAESSTYVHVDTGAHWKLTRDKSS